VLVFCFLGRIKSRLDYERRQPILKHGLWLVPRQQFCKNYCNDIINKASTAWVIPKRLSQKQLWASVQSLARPVLNVQLLHFYIFTPFANHISLGQWLICEIGRRCGSAVLLLYETIVMFREQALFCQQKKGPRITRRN